MPLVPGLNPAIRLEAPEEAVSMQHQDVTVENEDEGADVPKFQHDGSVIEIEHPDGSITISLDGRPISGPEDDGEDPAWFANIVSKIDDSELSRIAEDLLRGVEDDLSSRNEWIEDRAKGIKLLGLKIEVPGIGSSADGAPVEGMSKVRHPLLQEAVLRFQANARSELLPTDGPVKVKDAGNFGTTEKDRLATALERDMNHYLTSTASEYYPDTDRMLLLLGFGGTAFKKVYFCPLRNRPVSESVDADDLIVNNTATDLRNARRVTHRISMKPSTIRRMQILGVYRDIDLGDPLQFTPDSVQEEKMNQQGITEAGMNPDDRNREIYEIYCELDIKGFEHKFKGKETGLEIPYRVTLDVSSREVLSIVRNYNRDTEELPEARVTFVKYTFVPGFGFYDIGLLHILGNTTNAVTAAWRELLDAGMYANFPGFLLSDMGARQNTNVFRVPPGGAALVKTGGVPISQAVMPLPYKEPSQALMALVDNMAATGQRIGGTSEMQVGEGRADAPVGTTLAMIEQATKVLNSVHKRMHAAQAEEFRLLLSCFRENPQSFWQRNRKPAMQWDEDLFRRALDEVDLIPQADPNTASHSQRVMKIMALKQLQAASPSLYDPIAVDRAALQAIGWSNPEQFMRIPTGAEPPPPEILKGMADAKVAQQRADADTVRAQADAGLKQAQVIQIMRGDQQAPAGPTGPNPMELQLKAVAEANKSRQMELSALRDRVNDENRDKDREADLIRTQMQDHMEHLRVASQQAHERDMQMRDMDARAVEHAQKIAAQIEAAKLKGKAPD